MPETHWHVRSKITGVRAIVDVTEEQADRECKRLNRECATGVRAAYGSGDDHVPEQRLVAENNGQALTSVFTFPEGAALSDADLLDPSLVGRVLHAGMAMEYEVEREERMTNDEIAEAARNV